MLLSGPYSNLFMQDSFSILTLKRAYISCFNKPLNGEISEIR